MQKITLFTFLCMTLFFLNGCTSTFDKLDTGMLTSAALGGGAAYAGSELSNGNPWVTAGAGAGGFLVGELLNEYLKDQRAKEFQKGYDLGRSDAAKTSYWMNQRRQRDGYAQGGQRVVVKRYMFPAPEEIDGVRYVPHDYSADIKDYSGKE